MRQRPPIYPRTDTLFPYTTLCRSARYAGRGGWRAPLGRTTGPRGLNRMAGRDCDLTARSSIGTKRSMTRALDRFGRLDGLVNNYQALPWEENAARVGALVNITRSETRRVGNECVSTCRHRGSP